MSLLGRLEDLSLTDIIQIVFLSRRTGVLEIIDHEGRHTVLFRHGMIVNASAPAAPDLASFLHSQEIIDDKALALVRTTEEAGVPAGDSLLEMNILSRDALANAITERIASVVVPLLSSRDGEFNFILSESVGKADTEYDIEKVLPEGGVAPQKILGGEGEKLKPLRGLEESMKAGKALLRGTAAPVAEPEKLDLGLGTPAGEPPQSQSPAAEAAPFPTANIVPFPVEEPPFDPLEDTGSSLVSLLESEANPPSVAAPPVSLPAAQPEAQEKEKKRTPAVKFTTGTESAEAPEDEAYRNVVLFERDPLLRVAVRRTFNRKHINSFQFGTIDDTRSAVVDLLDSNRFFVTFLDLDVRDGRHDRDSIALLQTIKRRNRRLPVVVVDREPDLKRRHFLLAEGADLYLTKPSPAHLQPGLAEEQLALFADEFALFSDSAFDEWLESRGAEPAPMSEEELQRDRVERGTALARQLINELSNPNDVRELSHTILRLAEEYLERAVLFASAVDFVGLGGFGSTGETDEMNQRVRKIRISRSGDSVLSEVARTRQSHRGKLRRTSGNVQLIESLGKILPTSVVVLPIVNRDHVVGVLYGDNAESRGAIGDTNSLEVFLMQSGFAFENALIAMSRRAESSQDSR